MDLSTTYMGMDLRNPVIVSSSGLTQSVDGVRRCEEAGAGAVVLKSIFEEQIAAEVDGLLDASESALWHTEAAEYISRYGEDRAVEHYVKLIADAKAAVSIPVIASIHCVSPGTWTRFAAKIQEAGADALELNVFILPADPRKDGRANERAYFDIVSAVREEVSIPLALKVGPYFSGLAETLTTLSRTGIQALVLFNRFYRLDFDIEEMKIVSASALSRSEEIVVPLRWISILADQVDCDLAATTGVHDGAGVVKQLLAGAAAVQVCSTLYRNGIGYLGTILADLQGWMERHGFRTIPEFRGKMSRGQSADPAQYERVQFMKASVSLR